MEAGLDEMVEASLAAAVAPVRNAAGAPLDPQSLASDPYACEEGGTRFSISLDLETADNATSLERILDAWDAAGYLSDRAMQEDIRYSDTLPIDRMSIRDKSTIDGLIHMQIRTHCAASP